MEQKNNIGKTAMLLLAGLVIGGIIAYPLGKGMADDSDKNSESTAMQANSETNMNAGSDGVTVGGAKMVRTKDIVDNAVNAKNVTTVVAAVKAAGLVDTLKSDGPFTVFAPNNAAFDKLPDGTLDTLLKPESKDALTAILTYHVVPGTYTSADLKVMAQKGEMLTSVQGGMLMPVMEDNMVRIKDAKGTSVTIDTADVISSNGVTHVITGVLMQ